jgi:putative transposase
LWARLVLILLFKVLAIGKARAFSVTDETSVKPVRYMPAGAVPLFPPQVQMTRLCDSGKIYLNGWKKSATIRSSYATPLLLRLCS